MRAAVVSPIAFESWDERSAVLSRFIGGLACVADVDMLVTGADRATEPYGAAQRLVFPVRPADRDRLRAVEMLVLGPRPSSREECGCLRAARAGLAQEVPRELEDELVSLGGGDSPDLVDHLVASDYDLVVFTRPDTAATVAGVEALAGRCPTLLLPLVFPGPRLSLESVRNVFTAVDAVAATSGFEASIAAEAGAENITVIGCVLRVHPLALRNEPMLFEERAVVYARDWNAEPPSDDLLFTVERLNRDLEGTAVVRLIGPGWELLPGALRAAHAESRLDVWRWVTRSVALWDPDPRRLLGREVLEAMQYGTPVVTSWHGAAQEHAERGNGGLWYRSYGELLACLEALADDADLRKTLSVQGRAYSSDNLADTDAYIDRVRRLVDSLG